MDNRRFWDTQFEREWTIIAERLESGFGLTDDILQVLGTDFFKTDEELAAEVATVKEELETEVIGSGLVFEFTLGKTFPPYIVKVFSMNRNSFFLSDEVGRKTCFENFETFGVINLSVSSR